MANREALWINSGRTTQLDGTTDGLAATALDPGSAGTLTLGGTNATAIQFGANIDKDAAEALVIGGTNATSVQFGVGIDADAAQALVIGGTNATSVQFGAEITKDAAEELVIGQNTATSVRIQDLVVNANALYNAAAAALTIGGTNTTTIDIDSSTTSAISIGGTNSQAVNIGRTGQTTTIKGDLQVDGAETVTGTATFNGNTDIGDASSDTLTITASVDAAINFATGVTSHFTTTTGDLKIVPEGTTIVQGGLGTALTFTTYSTTNPVLNGVLTGVGTAFTSELEVGDAIEVELAGGTEIHTVAIITSNLILEVDAPFASVEADVSLGLNKDDNLFEVYTGDAKARWTIDKNGGLTVTRGAQDEAPLTLANDEDTIDAAIYVVDDDATNIASPANGDLALSTTGKLYWYGAATWNEAGTSTPTSLQGAYDQQGATAVQLLTNDWEIQIDDSAANWVITNEAGDTDYIATNRINNAIDLGSAAGKEVHFLGNVGTDIVFDSSARNITNDSGNLTLRTTTSGTLAVTGVAALDMDGTVVTLDGSTSIAIGTAADKPIDVDASTLTIDASDNSNLTVAANDGADKTLTIAASNAGVGDGLIDIDADGAITIDSGTSIGIGTAVDKPVDIDATTFTLDASAGFSIDGTGATCNVTAASQALQLTTTTSGNLIISAADNVDIDADAVTIDANNTNGFSIDGTAASNVTVDTGQLSISTTTSGEIDITSAGAVDINGGTNGLISIDAAGTGDITLTCADNASADVTFQAHGSAVIEFNGATTGDTGNKDLASTFTATSIIGALNELKADSGEFTISRTVGLGGVVAGNGVYIKVADSDVLKSDADAAESARLVGFARATAAEDASVLVDTLGEVTVSSDLSGDAEGEYVYLSGTAGEVTTTAPSSGTVLRVGVITDKGTGAGDGKILIQVGTPVSL